MPSLKYSLRAVDDAERLVDFLRESDPEAAEQTFGLIEAALNTLRDHPLIGRPAENGLRELVISRGKSGYLALYRFDERTDRVIVCALRHQREAGYE
jgi:plasmid stabilization system protein ParE